MPRSRCRQHAGGRSERLQLPVTQDQQLIGEGQHIGLVGNQDQRSLQGFQPGNRLQQRLLSRVVQIGIGLVEDDHGGQAVHGTRQPDALLLPTGQPGAAVAQHGVVPLWQLQDQFMDARHLRSGQHLVGIDLCKACDVVRDGPCKQLNVLRQIAQMRAELVFVPLRQVRAVQPYLARDGLPDPHQQSRQGGLAAA